MARGAVRRVTEFLITATVFVAVAVAISNAGLPLTEPRYLFAAPIAAVIVSIILKHGGQAATDRHSQRVILQTAVPAALIYAYFWFHSDVLIIAAVVLVFAVGLAFDLPAYRDAVRSFLSRLRKRP